MGIRVYWENQERTLICYDFDGVWSQTDLERAYLEAREMELSVNHRVDVMILGSNNQTTITSSKFILKMLHRRKSRPVRAGSGTIY